MPRPSQVDVEIVDYLVATGNYPSGQTEIANAISRTPSSVRNQLMSDKRNVDTLFVRGRVMKYGDLHYLDPSLRGVMMVMESYYFPLMNHDEPERLYDEPKDLRRPWKEIDLHRKRLFLESQYSDILFSPEGFLFVASSSLGRWFLNLGDGVLQSIADLLPPQFDKDDKDSLLGLINHLVYHSRRASNAWQRYKMILEATDDATRVREKMVVDELRTFQKETRLLIGSASLAFRRTLPKSLSAMEHADWYFMEPSLFARLARYSRLCPTLVSLLLWTENLSAQPFLYDADTMVFAKLRKKARGHNLEKEPRLAAAIREELVMTIRNQYVLFLLQMFQTFLQTDSLVIHRGLINDHLAKHLGIKGGLTEVNSYLTAKMNELKDQAQGRCP